MEHNHIPELMAEIIRAKALANLVETAKVTDADGNVVDLASLQADGSLATEGDTAEDADADSGEISDTKPE
jgi:trigger factor